MYPSDPIIRIWDIPTGECIKTLVGHEQGVCVVIRNGNQLISSRFHK